MSRNNNVAEPPVMSDTSEAASVQTINVEQKATEKDTTPKPTEKITLNDMWKNLDGIFHARLRKFVLLKDRDKFEAFASKLGFDVSSDREDLWECLVAHLEAFYPPPVPVPVPPPTTTTRVLPHSFSHQNEGRRLALSASNGPLSSRPPITSNTTNNKETSPMSFNSLYAIPNNRNERISGSKRKRNESEDLTVPPDEEDDDFSGSEDEDIAPKRKKRKKDKETVDNNHPDTDTGADNDAEDDLTDLWNTNDGDRVLTKEEEQKLAAKSVYIVAGILDHRKKDKKYEYYVEWEGYEDKTWEPPEHLNAYMMEGYWNERGGQRDPEGAMAFLRQQERERKKQEKKDKMRKKQRKKKEKKSKRKKKEKRTVNDEGNGTESDAIPGEYPCRECGKKFAKTRSRAAHMSVHYRDGKLQKKKKENEEPKDIVDCTGDTDDEQQREVPYWEDDDTEDDAEDLIVGQL